ncbi:MAG: YebC/PmpR family DNA-binding transcriptional regulator [Candidatus Levyibacteriota bacterium]
MSGHSKWAQIKRQKGVADVKRGATFTKLSNAITLAVKQGGGVGDPNQNFHLRLAIEAARNANMPKENIERAIKRAAGRDADTMQEAVYEGFGPEGIVIMVDAATDNTNRTTSEIKNVFEKNGGNMGQPGSVSYQFKQMGQIIVEKNGKTLDDILMEAADSGAEDIEDVDTEVFVYTAPNNLAKVKDALSQKGFIVKEASLMRKPTTSVEVSEQATIEKVMAFLDKLEELDDVQKVYSNFAIKD